MYKNRNIIKDSSYFYKQFYGKKNCGGVGEGVEYMVFLPENVPFIERYFITNFFIVFNTFLYLLKAVYNTMQ